MKQQMLLWLFSTALASVCLSQGRTIYVSSMVKPKTGQTKMVETAIMNHTQKYHGTDKMRIFEIVSGDNTGMYQLVQGPYAWSSLDSLKMGDAHDLDFDNTIAAKCESLTGENFVRLHPELSYGSTDFTIEKSRVVILDVKQGYMDSVKAVLQTLKQAMEKTKDGRNMTVYTKMLSGTAAQAILIYRFPNGWADMEEGKFSTFKDLLTKGGSEADWMAFQRLTKEGLDKTQTHLRVYRKDLSSK